MTIVFHFADHSPLMSLPLPEEDPPLVPLVNILTTYKIKKRFEKKNQIFSTVRKIMPSHFPRIFKTLYKISTYMKETLPAFQLNTSLLKLKMSNFCCNIELHRMVSTFCSFFSFFFRDNYSSATGIA